MIVADANLLVYLLVPGPSTQHAERIRAKEKVWIAPSLLMHELLSVLARYVSNGKIHRDEAARGWRRAMAMVEMSFARPDPIAILNMFEHSGCSTYDLEYVWLAKELNLPLLTADQEVLEAFPDVATSIQDFATGR